MNLWKETLFFQSQLYYDVVSAPDEDEYEEWYRYEEDDLPGGYQEFDAFTEDDFCDDEEYEEEYHGLTCTCEECIQNHPEREIYLDDDDVTAEQSIASERGGAAAGENPIS